MEMCFQKKKKKSNLNSHWVSKTENLVLSKVNMYLMDEFLQ